MFKRNRITSCLVIMFLVINQVSWFSHNCTVVPNNKIIHNCTVVRFIMKCCTVFLQFIFFNKIIVRSDVQLPTWKGYVHTDRMINERSDDRFQTPKYGVHTGRMTKQMQQPKCDVHIDRMIDERSDKQSPTPRCLLHMDGVTDEISDEGSPTPKCDVDTDKLMRGQTKDPTNRNVTTNVWHTHGRTEWQVKFGLAARPIILSLRTNNCKTKQVNIFSNNIILCH